MKTRYIFITGGVVSSLGKGIATSSIGALLRARGYRVTAVKIDPYINVDAGTMKPYEHGEVFVTNDGAETDLDLGTYERFLNIDLSRDNSITTGQVYLTVIQKERAGEYQAQTVQVIPHVTDEIKRRIRQAGETADAQVVLVEVGGTVGDIESLPFLEAIRQMRFEEGQDSTLYFHMTLLPYLGTSEEYKTKPTQHSVATLRGMGIQPDSIILRSKTPVPDDSRSKIALFTNVAARDVFTSADADYVYAVPVMLEQQGIGRFIERRLELDKRKPELEVWQQAVQTLRNPRFEVHVGIVGKYVAMPDAYLSLLEALKHAGIANDAHVNVTWVNSTDLTGGNAADLDRFDAILVPGGFGPRGAEGKILAAGYARTNGIPFLGICLGMQIAVIEFARSVALLEGASSTEFDPLTRHPVVCTAPGDGTAAGTRPPLRLGAWPVQITGGTLLGRLYGVTDAETALVSERHRNRFEINPSYIALLEKAGLTVSATTPGKDGSGEGLVEAIELAGHPFFLGVQSHPEFNSRLTQPSPPFRGLIQAALDRRYGSRAARTAGEGQAG